MARFIDLTIREVQREVESFLDQKGKGWTQIDNHFYLFTHLSEEIGELARHIITVEFGLGLDRRKEQPLSREEAISLIEDDLGDILYHIFKIAIAYNIDLAQAFEKAMTHIKSKYGKINHQIVSQNEKDNV